MPEIRAEAGGSAGASAPHERILEVAREMFCRDGIHATGIDRILGAAGASKMTLYARFGSKEALVRAVLREEGAGWGGAFFAVLAEADDPAERLRRVVPALAGWFQGERFYGCAFMNAVAEHTKGEAWLRELAAEHHREILAFLGAQAAAAGHAEPALVARQVLLLMDGMIAAAMVSGDDATVLAVAERSLAAILAQSAPAACPAA